jgi:hypothetical protein
VKAGGGARGDLELLWLYYAKGAAFAAILLAGASLFFGQDERKATAREAGLPAQTADTVVR